MIVDSTLRSAGGEQHLPTGDGAMLIDRSRAGSLLDSAGESIFDPDFWRSQQGLSDVERGRGSAWFVHVGGDEWVLRHYRRGGFVAKIVTDLYWWWGEKRVRAFAEWRLTDYMLARGLPVPVPIGARYTRCGPVYRCDLLTERISDAVPLSAQLARAPLDAAVWATIGSGIARMHAAGVDHADLNAHNILLDSQGKVTLIDFDRGKIRATGSWRRSNLVRLNRSLKKISDKLPIGRFSAANWRQLMAGYESD